MARPAAEIEPVSAMRVSSSALPGPIMVWSKTNLRRIFAIYLPFTAILAQSGGGARGKGAKSEGIFSGPRARVRVKIHAGKP